MPFVAVETVVAGPPAAAYALATDFESFPRFMDAVVYLKVLERDGAQQLSEWHARFQGRILKWKELDIFDPERHRITYHQTEGDLKKFEGEWTFEPVDGGTRIVLTVDFDLGIPMLAPLLDPVAKLITRQNSAAMLAAIKDQVERGG